MATIKPELNTILDRYGINPRDKDQLWDCHGTIVLYHKAYEVIAAKENITFDAPTFIETSTEKKTVAMLVVGRMGERSEWSIGECSPSNCKNAYPYAMAEKRAKDRVIAKLVGLAQYVYSEDEAEDFKTGERKPVEEAPRQQDNRQSQPQQASQDFWSRPSYALNGKGPEDFTNKLCNGIEKAPEQMACTKLWQDNEGHIKALPEELYQRCQKAMHDRMAFWSQHPTGKAA